MKKAITKLLGLPEDATEETIITAIEALMANNATTAATEAAIRAKMAAGLSREVAVEAIANQALEDAAAEKAPANKKTK